MREREEVTEWECGRKSMCAGEKKKKRKENERVRMRESYGEIWRNIEDN